MWVNLKNWRRDPNPQGVWNSLPCVCVWGRRKGGGGKREKEREERERF